jgi:uncharacterized damage-inducible protein DinB
MFYGGQMMKEQILDTWHISNQMLMRLLDAVDKDGLKGIPAGMKGRAVGEIFAHIHNVRLMWLEVSAPKLLDGLAKIPMKTKADKESINKTVLDDALEKSNTAMTVLFRDGVDKGKIKDCKPHVMGCFGYFIAHEWYHIGEICMTLTQAGYKLPDEILYGIWEWGKG